MRQPEWTDERLDLIIGHLLRGGVLLAAAVVTLGGALYLARYGHTAPNFRVFRGEPADLRSLPGILTDLLSLRRRAIIQFGLLLLIATPVARVSFSLYAFARERDRTYVVVTLVVLVTLLYSLVWGRV
jgi:uncharacterized membrane protein